MNLRDLFGVVTNQFHCYNQNMGSVNKMDQNVANFWCPNEKMVVVPVCLNGRCCYSGGILSQDLRKKDKNIQKKYFAAITLSLLFTSKRHGLKAHDISY